MRSYRFKSAFLAALLLKLALGSSQALAKLRVVTTLPSFASIATRVGGDEVDVIALTRGTQDPHFVDPKPDLILKLNRADLLIHAGLSLEEGWLPPLVLGSRNSKVQAGADGNLDASQAVQLKEVPQGSVDRSMGDVHPGGNPHYMLDPNNGILVGKAIADRLAKLEPAKSADFQKRYDEFAKEMKKKISSWSAALKPWSGSAIVTYHKSWIYFSSWARFKEVGYIEPKPGIPPSPEHVVKLIQLIKDKKAKLIFIEPYYPKGTSEHVAEQAGAKVVVLPSEVAGAEGVKTYMDVFDQIIARLKAAAK